MVRFFNKYFPLVFIYICVLALFGRGLFNFFFQDDFNLFTLAWVSSPSELIKLIAVVPHFPYRPLAFQALSAIELHVFKLNPFTGHLFLFLLHGLNILLLWKFLTKIVGKKMRLFVSFLYALSSTHFMSLYWWAVLYMLLGTLFVLLSYQILIYSDKKITFSQNILLVVLFFLMVATNEALIVFPLSVLIFAFFYNKQLIKKVVFPLFLTFVLLLPLRLLIAKYPQSGDYAIGSVMDFIKTAKWYFLRSLNLTEGIRAMDPALQKFLLILLFILFVLFLFALLSAIGKINKFNWKLFIFGICWYLIFAGPFFLLPDHLSPYYLNTALIGFLMSLAAILENIIQRNTVSAKIFLVSFLVIYGLMSFINVKFLNETHWVVWRSDIARKYIVKTLETYPELPKGSTVLFQNTAVNPSEIAVVLSGEKALRLYYNDPTLNTIYSPDNLNSKNVYLVSDSEGRR